MVSMWVNTAVVIGQLTAAAATVLGLAMLGSTEQLVDQQRLAVKREVHLPIFNISASSEDGGFLATLMDGRLAQGSVGESCELIAHEQDLSARRITFCAATNLIGIGTETGAIYLADARFPGLTWELDYVDSGIASISFSSDGKIICAGDFSGDLYVWDVESRHRHQVPVDGRLVPVHAKCFGTDRLAVVTADSGILKIWNLQTEAEIRSIASGLDYVSSLCISKCSRWLVVAGIAKNQKLLKLIEFNSGKVCWNYSVDQLGSEVSLPMNVSFSEDSTRVVLATGPYLQLHDVLSGETLKSASVANGCVSSMSMVPGSNDFLTAGYDGHVIRWHGTRLAPRWSVTTDVVYYPDEDE